MTYILSYLQPVKTVNLTWGQRAGLQLSDYVTKFSLQICAITVLQGHKHALDIDNPIALGIKLTKSLRKHSRKTEVNFWYFVFPYFSISGQPITTKITIRVRNIFSFFFLMSCKSLALKQQKGVQQKYLAKISLDCTACAYI